MGADFRPIDTLYWDERLHMHGHAYMHECHIVFTDIETGASVDLWHNQAREEYPNLSFLFSRFERELYDEMKRRPKDVQGVMSEVYHKIEDYLALICDDVRDKIRNNEKIEVNKPDEQSEDYVKYTYKWFLGELVQRFHYSEPNNEIFEDHIRDTIEKCLAEKGIKQAEEDKDQEDRDDI